MIWMCITGTVSAQNFSAGVNTESPNPRAVLHLVSPNGDQGLLIPQLTTAQRTSMAGSLNPQSNGLLVYDNEQGVFYFWLNSSWIALSVSDSQSISLTGTQLAIQNGNTVDLATLGYLTTEADPTVPANIKDGIAWTEVSGIPAGFADGVDNEGVSTVAVDGTTMLGDGNTDILRVGAINATQVNGLSTVATTGSFNDLVGVPANLDLDATNDLTVVSANPTLTGNGTAGTPLGVNVGTGAGQIVQIDAAGKLPAVDGSQLTNVTAVAAAGSITNTELAAGAVQSANILDGQIVDADVNATAAIAGTKVNPNFGAQNISTTGTITASSYAGDGSGLTGVTSTVITDFATIVGDGSVGTPLAVNVGTSAGQIVQLDAIGLLPAVDGSQLTNVTSAVGAGSITNAELASDAVQSANILDGQIVDADVNAAAAIAGTKVNPNFGAQNISTTGTVTATSYSGDGSGLTGVTSAVSTDGTTITGDGDLTALSVNQANLNITSAQVTGLAPIATTGDFADLVNVPTDLADGDDTGLLTVSTDGTTITGDGDLIALSVNQANLNITSTQVTGLAPIATTGDFADLINVPTDLADGDDTGLLTVSTDGTTITGDGDLTALSVNQANLNISSAQVTGLSAIATSGDFADLINVPTDLADGDDTGLLAVLTDGSTIAGDGDLTALSVAAVAPSLITAGGATGGQVLKYNGTNWAAGVDDGSVLNNGLIWVGSASNQPGPVTMSGDVTISNTGATAIAPDAVTTAKLIDGSVTTAKIADGTIANIDVAPAAAIDASKIADGSVSNAAFQLLSTGDPFAFATHSSFTAPAAGDVLTWDNLNARWDAMAANALTFPYSSVQSIGSSLFTLENDIAPAATFISSNDNTALEIRGDLIFFDQFSRKISILDNAIGDGDNLDISAGGTTFGGASGGVLNLRSGNGAGIGNGGNIRLEPGLGATNGGIDMRGITRFGQNGALPGRIELEDAGGANAVSISADGSSAAYNLILPPTNGTGALTNDGSGVLSWSAGGGDFSIVAVDNYIGGNAGTAIAGGTQNILIGPGAANVLTTGSNNLVVGVTAASALVDGTDNIVFGRNAGVGLVSTTDNVLIGRGANSTSSIENIAIGRSSTSSGGASLAIGRFTTADLNGVALGAQAEARAAGAIALGQVAVVPVGATGSIAIGDGSSANELQSIAIGQGATVAAAAGQSIAIGRLAQSNGIDGTSIGQNSNAIANGATAVGAGSTAGSDNTVALGFGASVSGSSLNSIAIGSSTLANADNSIVLGYFSQTTAADAIAIGREVTAANANSVVIGDGTAPTPLYNVGINTGSPRGALDVVGAAYLAGPIITPPTSNATINTLATPVSRIVRLTAGSGTINSITAGQDGQEVILVKGAAGTLTIGLAGNIRLNAATSFNMDANDTLHLIFEASSGFWLEIGRSVN